jgi:predicted phosphodiesterase
MNRRQFVATAALASGAALMPSALRAGGTETALQTPGSFNFLFLTDTHIQPELDGANGCATAFRKAAGIRADFAIQGGDHVFDALAVDRKRADSLFDLYGQTEQAIGMKVYHTMGNHDHFGLYTKSGVEAGCLGYAKEMYRERVGATYYSFDHKGYHFVVLDTVQPTADRSYEARIDDEQLAWLRSDLGKIAAGTPVIVSAHVPLVSGMRSYVPSNLPKPPVLGPEHPQLIVINANDAMQELQKHNTLAVFQGHIHVNEVVTYRDIHYVSSGAVSGNWWHGPFLGTPEGFMVVSLNAGKIDWHYETSGFKSVASTTASW